MSSENPTLLTAAGQAALAAELAELRGRRAEVVARLADTRGQGDLRENAGYHQAREDQARLEGRIAAIEQALRSAVLIAEGSDGGRVRLGSTVTVRDEHGESEYVIVGPAEADPLKGRLSHESPVGRALIGARPGDDVTVEAPGGARTLSVTAVA